MSLIPSDLSGLVLWTQYETDVTTTGQGVSQWDDQSGQGNHLKQATDADRPLPGSVGDGETYGAELVTNGTFTGNATGWQLGTGWAYDTNNITATAAVNNVVQSGLSLTNAATYLVTFTISGYVDGTYVPQLYGEGDFYGEGTGRTADGTYTELITIDIALVAAGGRFILKTLVDGTATIDDVSIKLVSAGGELVTNGNFYSDADDWTLGTGWAYDTNNITSTAASGNCSQTISFTNGATYLVTYTISGYVDGTYQINLSGTLQAGVGTSRTANGTYTELVTIDAVSGSSGTLYLQTIVTGTATIDDISVKLVDTTAGILFDGVSDFLKADAFTLVQPETVYVLCKQVTWGLGDYLFDGNTNNRMICYQQTSSPNIVMFAGFDGSLNNALVVDTYGILACVYNNTTSSFQINNSSSEEFTSGTNDAGGFTLGSIADGLSSWSNIQVKEVLVYNTAHTAAERSLVIQYLNGENTNRSKKWVSTM